MVVQHRWDHQDMTSRTTTPQTPAPHRHQPHSPVPMLIPSASCRTPVPDFPQCHLQEAMAEVHVLVGPQPICSAGSSSTPKQAAQHTQPILSLDHPALVPAPRQMWMPCPKCSGIGRTCRSLGSHPCYTALRGFVRAEFPFWLMHQETPSDIFPGFTSMGTHCSPSSGQ